MKPIIVILAAVLSWSSQARALGGNGVNNGGDAVECRASVASSFSGTYSLDFLVQYDARSLPVAAKSLAASLQRIEDGLRSKIPSLAESFREFREGVFNETDFSKPRIWERAAFGLTNIRDEDLVTSLPENCRSGDRIDLIQAVVRQPPKISGRPADTYVYKFMPDIVGKLEKSDPVQLSFLIVHEWLWDFSKNVERNRRVNYWLHSDRLENRSAADWATDLGGAGFSIPGMPEPAFSPLACEPHEPSKLALEKALGEFRRYRLGTGNAYQRTRLCEEENTCSGHYFDTSNTFRSTFGTNIYLRIETGLLIVESGNNFSRAEVSFTCKPGRSKFECSDMVSYDGYKLYKDPKFEVDIGKNCVRMRAKSVGHGFRDSQIDEYAIYFDGVQMP